MWEIICNLHKSITFHNRRTYAFQMSFTRFLKNWHQKCTLQRWHSTKSMSVIRAIWNSYHPVAKCDENLILENEKKRIKI